MCLAFREFGSFLSFSCITDAFLLHPNILKDLAQLTILVNPGYYFKQIHVCQLQNVSCTLVSSSVYIAYINKK